VFAAMPSEKRQRQDEGRLLRLEEQRVATQKVQRKRQFKTLGIILGAVLVVAGLFAIFSADDADVDTAGDGTTTTAADDSTSTTASDTTPGVEVVLPGAGASITGETPCPPADGSAERTTSFEQAPPTCIDPDKTYTATVATNKGDIVIELDSAHAPIAVNNFVVLSRYHFYDNVPFHRIVPGFVNQAGDPVGPEPGTGGPGYTIPDELPADPATAYPPGTVAMANSGPESGGSQFFLVIGDPNSALSGAGSYSVFGKVVEGQDVSEAINALGGPDQLPTAAVTITSVTITEE
jgi:peptidyl-prolyl cis-trans isomerase B (cyclophilin B)